MSERVRVAIADGVADVRLDRPDKLNALDTATFEALVDAGERLASHAGLRAVVLSGEGRAFCAGIDLEVFASSPGDSEAGPLGVDLTARTHGSANLFQAAALVWRRLPVPVIAAIHGVAFGGGLQIALGADMRFVAPDAKLSVMEIRWGLVPDMGGVLALRELVRPDLARELTYTGRVVTGAEAVEIGLCTRVENEPRAAALAAAAAIAAQSPDAIRSAKRLLTPTDEALEADILLAESRAAAVLIGSPNQREAVASGLGRRPAVFRDAG